MSETATKTPTDEFVEDVIAEYSDLYDEIGDDVDRAEHDLVPRLIDHLFINTLGWDKSDYQQKDDWNDVRFFDDDDRPVIIVEGKRRSVNAEDGEDTQPCDVDAFLADAAGDSTDVEDIESLLDVDAIRTSMAR